MSPIILNILMILSQLLRPLAQPVQSPHAHNFCDAVNSPKVPNSSRRPDVKYHSPARDGQEPKDTPGQAWRNKVLADNTDNPDDPDKPTDLDEADSSDDSNDSLMNSRPSG